MTWERAVYLVRCGSCRADIAAGRLVLRVTSGRLARCEACALRLFWCVPDSDVPEMPAPAAPVRRHEARALSASVRAGMSITDALAALAASKAMPATTGGNRPHEGRNAEIAPVKDWALAAAGEREVGSDDE